MAPAPPTPPLVFPVLFSLLPTQRSEYRQNPVRSKIKTKKKEKEVKSTSPKRVSKTSKEQNNVNNTR